MGCLRIAFLFWIIKKALTSPLTSTGQHPTCQKTKVAVLGAGVAGITAAQALSNNSVEDFLIVEYNGEIGGRCRHASFGKDGNGDPYTIELGSNWIQGTVSPGGPENPIWRLVNKYHVRNHFSNYSNLLTYDTHGLVSYSDKFDRFKAAYDRVDKAAGLILNQSLPDGSFREALHDNDWDPTGDPQAQVVEYLSLDYEYNESPEVSSQLFTIANCNSTYFGFSRANFFATDQRGFNRFIHGQASEFLAKDDSRLLLNTVVTEISYDEDGVVITDARGGCINADYAITTFSVGVLQSGDVKFTPVLPQWKRTAIQTFEMGIYTKIFFQFPPDKVFWDTNIEYFLYASPTRGYYPVHQSLDHTDFHPESGLFLVTVVTEQSRIIERQDNETTKQQILAVLRQMFGEDKVPEPLDFMYPRWGMSPWAYGSYSNWPPGLTLKGHQNLRANVSRVWFAGEATSDEFYGYLQGAYFEGQVVGELVAACVNGTDPKCPGQKHYDTLSATSKKEDFGPENGWYKTSFQTLGDVDSGGSS